MGENERTVVVEGDAVGVQGLAEIKRATNIEAVFAVRQDMGNATAPVGCKDVAGPRGENRFRPDEPIAKERNLA
jgi:hypothetical protein